MARAGAGLSQAAFCGWRAGGVRVDDGGRVDSGEWRAGDSADAGGTGGWS